MTYYLADRNTGMKVAFGVYTSFQDAKRACEVMFTAYGLGSTWHHNHCITTHA